MIKIPKIKSPLRYPGGKSRALKQILPIIPEFKEFREPMVGGGSVFFAVKQIHPDKKYYINDVNEELFLFFKYCKEDLSGLILEIERIKEEYKVGKELYQKVLNDKDKLNELQRAARFFILNRITFSGLAESGGYSDGAFKGRFTESSIKRLKEASKVLQNTKITNEDYEKSITEEGENVFIFLDPPYLSKTKSKLYGEKGKLHEGFNHERFAEIMKKCKHKWLVTYDDSPEIKALFNKPEDKDKIFIYEWELQYGMNNFKQKTAAKGKELFILNYEIPSLAQRRYLK